MTRSILNSLCTILALLVIVLAVIVSGGCTEAQKQPAVWGEGELAPEWVAFFGEDNPSRLNKAQNDMLNRHQALLRGLDGKDKDGKPVHQNGVIDIMLQLDARVKALEAVDPNAVTIDKFDNSNRIQQDWNSDIAMKVNEIIANMNGAEGELLKDRIMTTPETTLLTVDEFEVKIAKDRKQDILKDWGTGVACPKCGTEMVYTSGWIGYKRPIHCPECKHEHRIGSTNSDNNGDINKK